MLNPKIPKEAREEAIKKVLRAESQDLVHNNRVFHSKIIWDAYKQFQTYKKEIPGLFRYNQ